MRAWRSKVKAILTRKKLEEELHDELDEHLQMEIDANLDRGMTLDEATEMATRRIGNRTVIQEQCREAWMFYWLETLLQDIRVAWRSLRRNPTFSLVAILILAAGIGASTAVFSVVNAVVLKPLAFHDPDRIVALRSLWKKTGDHGPVSLPDFEDWGAQSTSFDAIAYYDSSETAVAVKSSPAFANVARVSGGFFQVLGIDPAIGRLFRDEETASGSTGAVVVSHSFWTTHLGGDPSVVGETIRIAGHGVQIVGIMPIGFQFPDQADIWIPADTVFRVVSPNRGGHNYFAVAKLKSGATLESARAEMTVIGNRLEQQYPGTNGELNVAVTPLGEEMARGSATMLYLLLGAVLLLLLISIGNVGNLLLAKAASRTREIGVRAALGAGRVRIVRQLITESLVLGVTSGLAGLAIAKFGTVALVAMAPANVPRLEQTGVDASVLAFATILTLVACVLFGLAPAVQASRVDVHQALKQAGSRGPGGIGSRLRRAFVVGEIAFSVVLLTGAGLLIRSFAALSHVPLGFDTQQVLVMETSNPTSGLEGAQRVVQMYQTLLDEIARVPGVASVAAARIPPGRVSSSGAYEVDQMAATGRLSVQSAQAVYSIVSPGTFAVLGIPVRAGRDFSASDGPDAPRRAIVNETLARKAFPGADPTGHMILTGMDSLEPMTIIGVVGDTRQRGPGDESLAEVYMPYQQHPLPSTAMRILVRTSVTPESTIEPLRRTAKQIAPEMPVKFTTMEARLSEDVAVPRFRTLLLAIFATIAIALSIAGVYGVVSFLVNQRTQEIGLRMALGAGTGQVQNMILWQGVWMAVIGLTLGLAGAAVCARFVGSMLFEVTPFDPGTYVVAGGLIVLVTVGASAFPARRASRIDPMLALRQE